VSTDLLQPLEVIAQLHVKCVGDDLFHENNRSFGSEKGVFRIETGSGQACGSKVTSSRQRIAAVALKVGMLLYLKEGVFA